MELSSHSVCASESKHVGEVKGVGVEEVALGEGAIVYHTMVHPAIAKNMS